jgi:hypothetical protein
MLIVALVPAANGGPAADKAGRTVLPVPAPAFKGKIGTTLRDSTPGFPQQILAPAGAPLRLRPITACRILLPEQSFDAEVSRAGEHKASRPFG